MRNLKKLGNNPMKKNSSSSKGVQVLTQHIGISASKARRIIDQIRGRSYEETLTILKFMPYQASSIIFKLVYSVSSMNSSMKQVQVRNGSFSEKLYYSVKVRTCFQKDSYYSLIRFFLLCSYSDLYNLDQQYHQLFVIKREGLW